MGTMNAFTHYSYYYNYVDKNRFRYAVRRVRCLIYEKISYVDKSTTSRPRYAYDLAKNNSLFYKPKGPRLLALCKEGEDYNCNGKGSVAACVTPRTAKMVK